MEILKRLTQVNHQRLKLPSILVLIFPLTFILSVEAAFPQIWTEETFEDFIKGEFDASGQNLFVSSEGKIRTIHRFDLNSDGNLDLVFNNTHNTSYSLDASLATFNQDRLHIEPVTLVDGSEAVAVADMNNNGYSDMVFSPGYTNVKGSRRFLKIYWGGSDGWNSRRANGLLPVDGERRPHDIAIADLTGNGWKDIITLCISEHPEFSEVLRIFYGGENGFSRMRYIDIPLPDVVAVEVGDFDGDGAFDVAALTSDDQLHLIWGEPGRTSDFNGRDQTSIRLPEGTLSLVSGVFSQDQSPTLIIGTSREVVHILSGMTDRNIPQITTFDTDNATDLTIADIDGDGYKDLIATYLMPGEALGGEAEGAEDTGHVKIFWGDNQGFSPKQSTSLDIDFPIATAVADLTGNGNMDIAVAIHQTYTTFQAESRLFIGEGNRQFELYPDGIPTSGATDVTVVRKTKNAPANMIFTNSMGGNVGEKVPLQIYWGGDDGFNPTEFTEIPFRSGYQSTATDLNGNGYVDLIALNSGHGQVGQNPDEGANIYWGSSNGFNNDNKMVLNEEHLATSNVADLNRNGYLDIVLGSFQREKKEDNGLAIYYGSEEGFTEENREFFPMDYRSHGNSIADFNQDGWLDIAMVCYLTDRMMILWGNEDGFSVNNMQEIEVPSAISIESADLNASGYLDIIVGSFNDPITGDSDTGLFIFWGSENGFSHWDAQWLPGMAPIGFTVADFDNDGHLDLFSPHYQASGRREMLPSYLYWGGSKGFSPKRKTSLIVNSAHDSMAGDFNGNGLLDLAVAAHFGDGTHETNSKVFYNDGNRFENPEVTALPTKGTHWMYHQDTGHIYHRKWEQTYKSSTFEWDGNRTEGTLEFNAEIPGNSELQFFIRLAANEDNISESSWQKLADQSFQINQGDRILQYKAVFISDNGDRYPTLDQVEISIH